MELGVMIEELSKRKEVCNLMPKGGVGAEVGVMRGMFAKALARTTQPKKFHLIDFWSLHPKKEIWLKYKEEVKSTFPGEIEAGDFVLHDGRSENILKTFPDNYFDWMYIDANHQYHRIKTDIELSLPKLKKGGILAGHDFHCAPYGFATGVLRAVIEKVQTGEITIIAFSNEEAPDWVSIKN